MGEIRVVHDGLTTGTSGLTQYVGTEVRLRCEREESIPGAHLLLDYIATYVVEEGATIKAGQTIVFGYWLLKLVAADDGVLDIFEVVEGTADELVPGAELALRFFHDQHAICSQYGTEFRVPVADALAGVSESVLSSRAPFEGVRYAAWSRMSGWYFLEDGWNGDMSVVHPEHLYHVTQARPEIAKYLALPRGWTFRLDNTPVEDVTFDVEVARQPPP